MHTSRVLRVPCRDEWQRQARLLAVLCCGVLGSTQDVLLELAAARLLTLLLDPLSWACFPQCKGLALQCCTNCVSLLASSMPRNGVLNSLRRTENGNDRY